MALIGVLFVLWSIYGLVYDGGYALSITWTNGSQTRMSAWVPLVVGLLIMVS